MTSQIVMPTLTGESDHADYEDSVLRFNIKLLLAKSQNVTQTVLAKKFGITTAGMSQKINKPGRISVRDAVIIADELGVTLGDLLDDRAMVEDIERRGREVGQLLELTQRGRASSYKPGDQSAPESGRGREANGAPRGTRTHNPRLKRTLL